MFTLSRIFGIVFGVMTLMSLCGCGAIKTAKQAAESGKELKILGVAYHDYAEKHGAGPADQNTFQQWAKQNAPQAVDAIGQTGEGGKYTLIYGRLKFEQDFPQGTSFTVLAYENNPSPGGRVVLMADGSVTVMNEAQFSAANRPGVVDASKAEGGKTDPGQGDPKARELRAIGDYYQRYWAANKNEGPPARPDLINFAKTLDEKPSTALYSIGVNPSEFFVYFGCNRDTSFPNGADKTVLGYENQEARGGRLVLTADGKVWRMTEEAFAAAPRPKTANK